MAALQTVLTLLSKLYDNSAQTERIAGVYAAGMDVAKGEDFIEAEAPSKVQPPNNNELIGAGSTGEMPANYDATESFVDAPLTNDEKLVKAITNILKIDPTKKKLEKMPLIDVLLRTACPTGVELLSQLLQSDTNSEFYNVTGPAVASLSTLVPGQVRTEQAWGSRSVIAGGVFCGNLGVKKIIDHFTYDANLKLLLNVLSTYVSAGAGAFTADYLEVEAYNKNINNDKKVLESIKTIISDYSNRMQAVEVGEDATHEREQKEALADAQAKAETKAAAIKVENDNKLAADKADWSKEMTAVQDGLNMEMFALRAENETSKKYINVLKTAIEKYKDVYDDYDTANKKYNELLENSKILEKKVCDASNQPDLSQYKDATRVYIMAMEKTNSAYADREACKTKLDAALLNLKQVGGVDCESGQDLHCPI